MAKQLSKSFSQIADILPRTDLSLVLYPTVIMKETVARLYAHIIQFVIHAVRWYKQGKFTHAWASTAKPWALSFKTISKISQSRPGELKNLHVVHREWNFGTRILKYGKPGVSCRKPEKK